MACPACRRRAGLLAALAPGISHMGPLKRDDLLGLLGLPEKQLLQAVRVEDPGELCAPIEADRRKPEGRDHTGKPGEEQNTESVPTALCRHDLDYPEALAQLDSAPAVLYATCEVQRLRELLTGPIVALVGNLAHTGYAQQVAFSLAHDLATAGVTILSGLNDGVEGTAHRGTLQARGQSVAVLASAPDTAPARQRDEYLHQCILARGAALSEFPPGFRHPPRWCFVASQRIIAALADCVVVIEAGERSIALFTAQLAAELGRDVAAVPGRVTDPGAHGTLALLRDGAHPVGSAQDLLDLIAASSKT